MNSIVQNAASQARPSQRWFWLAGALFAALVVIVGFSPTFYLRNLFGTPQLSALKLVHGTVFSAWVVLFVAQTWLVATNRRGTHRVLGAFGALLLAAMCVVGYRMAIESGRSGFTPDPAKVSALSFMAVPLFDLGVFALLVSAALLLRARSERPRGYHATEKCDECPPPHETSPPALTPRELRLSHSGATPVVHHSEIVGQCLRV